MQQSLASSSDETIVCDLCGSRSLRKSGSGDGPRNEIRDPGDSTMAGKPKDIVVGMHMVYAYGAGVVTGLAIFGALNYYLAAIASAIK